MIFSSTIIPTVGRSSLDRAVQSVLDQSFNASNFEVIVVNDSGKPLPIRTWQLSNRVRIYHTNHRERSVARNTGAAVALGDYLHFLDDDDWILPGALQGFWELSREHPETDWLLGGSRLVDRQGDVLIELHHQLPQLCFIHTIAGEWIPLQASLISRSAFFAIGGFNPLISATEDVDLSRRILLQGALAETDQIIACIGMGTEESTTDHVRSSPDSRKAREAILEDPTAYHRMLISANTPYWSGRIVRAYLTSAIWNLRHRMLFTACSRSINSVLGFLRSYTHWIDASFWMAIFKPYQSQTFSRGFEAAESPLRSSLPANES
jgi:glycosyltransferase involved in cell wall biosynthesis